jgi:hypothetical protein
LKEQFKINTDCPPFKRLFPFSQASAGESIGATVSLNHQDADIQLPVDLLVIQNQTLVTITICFNFFVMYFSITKISHAAMQT